MGIHEKSIISATTLCLVFIPCGVASGAVLEVRNSFLAMFLLNFRRIVLVAGIAIIRDQAVRMADLAGIKSTLAMIEGKSMRLVIESWHPGGCIMAGQTIDAKQSQMIIWLCVAGRTFLRGTTKDTIDMALSTRHSLMGSCQLKCRQ